MYSNDAPVANKAARLVSPYVVHPSQTVCLQFDYYMYGADVKRLNFVSVADDENPIEIWEQSYEQGDEWRSYSKTLRTFRGEIVLEGWTDLDKEADLAVDNIRISSGSCDVDEGRRPPRVGS